KLENNVLEPLKISEKESFMSQNAENVFMEKLGAKTDLEIYSIQGAGILLKKKYDTGNVLFIGIDPSGETLEHNYAHNNQLVNRNYTKSDFSHLDNTEITDK